MKSLKKFIILTNATKKSQQLYNIFREIKRIFISQFFVTKILKKEEEILFTRYLP